MRIILILLVALLLAAGGLFVAAGRVAAPAIQVAQPLKFVGVDSTLDVTVDAPAGTLTRLDITLDQNGKSITLFSMATPTLATMKQESADKIQITREIGRRALPSLEAGPGKITVVAARKGLFGLRTREATASRDFQARFTPPTVSVVSSRHYINLGGSEAVVYRVNPPDVESGVEVGDRLYRGYPVSGAGVSGADPGLKVAFFALLWEQDLNTPIKLYARDEAGNAAHAAFDHEVKPKTFLKSKIQVDDKFLQRVVPDILAHSPELKLTVAAPEDYLPAYLKLNNELRRLNAEKITSVTSKTAPTMLWNGPFVPLGNAAVESKFADHRFYYYKGEEVDQQTHLGFDLAVTANIPVRAGNDGKVVYADYLGIYGNCVIVDHGMGLSSLYGHLSEIDTTVGDTVKKGQIIGKSGTTGLAGGDHLHFSVQLLGQPVNPVEWWDAHWIEDRVMRKLREAGGGQAAAATVEPPAAHAKPQAQKKKAPARRR